MLTGVFYLLCCIVGHCLAHVALTYPPARKYDLDFLDNGRTKAPCGMPKGDTVTQLPAASGAMINVTWHLAYPHRGGFKLELLDKDDKYLMDLTPTTPTTDYVGSEDTTAQSYTVSFPESLSCKGCTIRLLRQAQEWGHQYLFWSCADVDIVPVTELRTVCSNHGKINAFGQCQCDHLYSGNVCQYKDECWNDGDCGSHGKCINIDATTFPKKQCFCEIGWFGEKCSKESAVKDMNIDYSKYSKQDLSDEFSFYWRILQESEELEAVMKVKSTSYVAIGWRPHDITKSCKAFPVVQDKILSRSLEPSPRHIGYQNGKAEPQPELNLNVESKFKSKGKSKSEPEPVGEVQSEPKAEGKAEPEPKAEGKAEPEPKAEGKAEPEPKDEGKAEPEPKAEGKAEPEPKAEGKAEPEPKAEGKAEPEPKAEGKAEPEPKAEGKAEPEPKAEGKAEGKAEPEGKGEGKAEPEPKAERKAEPEPKAEGKAEPEPKAEGSAEPEPKAEGKAEPESKSESEPKAEGSAEPEPKAEGSAEPEPKAEGKAEPEPKAEGSAESEPKAEGSAEPEPKAEGKAEPEPIIEGKDKSETKIEKTESKQNIDSKANSTPEQKDEVIKQPISHPQGKQIHDSKIEHKIESKHEVKPEVETNSESQLSVHHVSNVEQFPEVKLEPSTNIETIIIPKHNSRSVTVDKTHEERKPRKLSYIVPNPSFKVNEQFLPDFANDQNFPFYPSLNLRLKRQIVSLKNNIASSKQSIPEPETNPEPINKPSSSEPSPEIHYSTILEATSKHKLLISKSEPESEPTNNNNIDKILSYKNYPEKTPYTPRADFHAMDCTDIVIGVARGSLSRIADFYTRDRSTPKIDSYFGGKDDITAAMGYEIDGITTILFRKKLKATDFTDHSISNNLMDVIWARGQEPNMYIHSPTTGLESGKAKILDFYRPDELKYHGHGKQRGKLTLNFLSNSQEKSKKITDCMGEWKYPENCDEKCEYSVKWKFLDATDEISFTVNTIHTDRWTGIAFSKDKRMSQTDAVIGWVDHIGRATILDVWLNDYTPPKLDLSQDIYNISGERKNGQTSLHFVRKRFTIDFDNDIRFSDTECSYFMFPVKGGTFNAISKKIGKHETTPIVSQDKICIRKCQDKGATSEPEPESKPEPKSEPESKSEPEPESEPNPESEPKPESEPEPKSEPETKSEPEPNNELKSNQFVSSCLGEWKSPGNCEAHNCEYKANWFYIDESDEIIFTVSSKSYNKWTGIGFSKNKAMTETDAILGWIEETGRSFIMDTWLDSYSTPTIDPNQNIYNATGQRVNGTTVLQFVRKHNTGDNARDLQFSNDCFYFMYPVHGGVFNTVNKRIRKHESTPIVSNEKICIHSCRSKGLSTLKTKETTLKIPPTTYPSTVISVSTTVSSETEKTSPVIPTTTADVTVSPVKYSVEVKLPQMWKTGLNDNKSFDYQKLQQQILQEMKSVLGPVNGFQAVELDKFESDKTEPDDVIAKMKVILSNNMSSKEGRQINTEERSKQKDLYSVLNSTIHNGKLGNLPVDPSHLSIVALASAQDRTPYEVPINQESTKDGLTDEQIKIYIIIAGVLALVFLIIVQASCMIYRDRRNKQGSHTKEKLLNNSHWRDYSVTASSNYSYENFAMQEDENKISKHPVGSVSNGSALSHANSGLGLSRVGPPDRPLPRNSGYSATFERMALRRGNGQSGSSPPSYATHDRSMRSMSANAYSQQELRPDFYFMPHQRRYSGEVVRVFVDYNNPEYTGK
ncbi:uncharacterized protein [Centruroides vittatus]|uniref:uncharacterized protein isoform X3 n=1 Tax=Centruroides vittatus TaxID=120091 RepID=UPI00350EB4A4